MYSKSLTARNLDAYTPAQNQSSSFAIAFHPVHHHEHSAH